MKIAIAVCTRERPKMLKRQLEAVAGLELPPEVELDVVVVENGPNPCSSGIVAAFEDRLSIEYHTEPRVGLVFARNHAVEKALVTGADWIGFIDDDEQIDKNWIVAMVGATQKFPKTRAFAGPVDRIDPETTTKWFPRHQKQIGKTGQRVWNVATGNVLFHRDVYADDRMGMRFDERFNLTGGEDLHLFLKMRQRGVDILWVQDAICTDYVSAERATLKTRVVRSIRYMHCLGILNQTLYGAIIGRVKNLLLSFKMLFHSVSYVSAGGLFYLFNRARGEKYLAVSLLRLSRSIGYLLAVFVPLSPVYAQVDGN